MENEMVSIPKSEYKRLKHFQRIDRELLDDIAKGIRDILQGRIREV
jgi:hypothetical protein